MPLPRLLLLAISLCLTPLAAAQNSTALLQPSDRILLLGDTVIERAKDYGQIEAAIQLAAAGQPITLRNLGWSGDTVFGDARSYFDPPEKGLERLDGHVAMVDPTILIVCYGSALAWEDEPARARFLEGYKALLDRIAAHAPNLRTVIIASPPPLESLGHPLPVLSHQNQVLALLNASLKELAQQRGALFVDWFSPLLERQTSSAQPQPRLTDNGVHYGEEGYQLLAATLCKALELPVPGPIPPTLTASIIEKDRLFFHFWRPANETYLFGFRKHEQGQNAAELEQFHQLLEQADAAITQATRSALGTPLN
jgi:lysophospholipase L1-like esterase